MKKLAVLALCLAFLAAAGPLAAQNVIVLKVKVQTANVRAEADTSSSVIKQVALGTLLEARQKIGDWYEITITNETGAKITAYISASVVDVVVGGAGAPPAQAPVQAQPPAVSPPTAPAYQPPPAPIRDNSYAPSTGGFKLFAGFGSASMSMTDTADYKASDYNQYKKGRTGLAAGIGFESGGGALGFEIDLLYLQKGVSYQGSAPAESGGGTDTFDVTSKLDEVSVPVLLKFHVLNKPGQPDFYLAGGGEIAYLMSAKLDYTVSGPDIGASPVSATNEDIKDNVNQIDYGLVFGGGVSFSLGGIRLFVEGRYHMGLANMEKTVSGETPSGTSPKTNALLIVGGLKF